MRKCANISPYMRRPWVKYDFATAPLWISFMKKIVFPFLCTGDAYYACTLYGAVDFLNVLKKGCWGVCVHCKKSWRSSSTPASGDAGPIHTGIEQIFRHPWRKFDYKYRTFSTEFFKCRTCSTEMDCLKSNITWARTYVFRCTFQYSTTAPHFLLSFKGGSTYM